MQQYSKQDRFTKAALRGTLCAVMAACCGIFFFVSPALAQGNLLNDFGDGPLMPSPLDRLEGLKDTEISDDEQQVEQPRPGRMSAAQKAQKELEQKTRTETFERAVEQLMPLKPEEIRELLRRFSVNREAVETPVDPYPEPQINVVNVSLDPSFEPPVIMLAPGHVTTVTVLDSTGSAWGIQDISWAGNYQVVDSDDGAISPGEEGGHIFRVTPLSAHGGGNLSMRLIGLNTPITFTLRTQKEVVHYRFDVRVPGFGPRAKVPIIESGDIGAVAGGGFLTAVLDGTPPSDAEMMKISGVDGRTKVWGMGDQIYVRTPHTLLSPGWKDSATSADGTNVYSLSRAPVLLMSDNGRVVRAHVSDFDDEDLP